MAFDAPPRAPFTRYDFAFAPTTLLLLHQITCWVGACMATAEPRRRSLVWNGATIPFPSFPPLLRFDSSVTFVDWMEWHQNL